MTPTTGSATPVPPMKRIKTRIEHEVDTRSIRLAAGLIRMTTGADLPGSPLPSALTRLADRRLGVSSQAGRAHQLSDQRRQAHRQPPSKSHPQRRPPGRSTTKPGTNRPNSASNPSAASAVTEIRRLIGASTISASGSAAPTAKLTADTTAACSGRANPPGCKPSSSRTWLPSEHDG
jgi:hypothetical protein